MRFPIFCLESNLATLPGFRSLREKESRGKSGAAEVATQGEGPLPGAGRAARAGPEVPPGRTLAVSVLGRFSKVGGAVLAGSCDVTSPCRFAIALQPRLGFLADRRKARGGLRAPGGARSRPHSSGKLESRSSRARRPGGSSVLPRAVAWRLRASAASGLAARN